MVCTKYIHTYKHAGTRNVSYSRRPIGFKKFPSVPAEDVPYKCHEYVEAVQPLVGVDREIQCYDGQLVGLGDAERLVEVRDQVRQLLVLDELRGVRVVALPSHVEHVKVILRDAHLLLLVGLVEVLEDHRDVHVDDDEEGNEDERHHEEDGDARVAAVPVRRLQMCQNTYQIGGMLLSMHAPHQICGMLLSMHAPQSLFVAFKRRQESVLFGHIKIHI